jgi:hypothetical protein
MQASSSSVRFGGQGESSHDDNRRPGQSIQAAVRRVMAARFSISSSRRFVRTRSIVKQVSTRHPAVAQSNNR